MAVPVNSSAVPVACKCGKTSHLQIPGSHRNNQPETRRLRGDKIEVVAKTLMEIHCLLRKMEGPDDRKVHQQRNSVDYILDSFHCLQRTVSE